MKLASIAIVAMILLATLVTVGRSWPLEDSKDFSEYCCCSTHDVLDSADDVWSLLDDIVKHPFFRFFKVNVHRECPYWIVSLLCTGKGSPCTVCKCNAEDVPFQLLSEGDMGIVATESDENAVKNSDIQRSQWSNGMGGLMEGFDSVDEDAPGEEYVDLVHNPESHTGYAGELANRIWDAVYRENCFSESDKDTCSEQLVFYRLISGLHASISTHLSVNYHRKTNFEPIKSQAAKIEFSPNCAELDRRVLSHPERMENMIMLYQFVLRALTRAASNFLEYKEYSPTGGSPTQEDIKLEENIKKLFQVKLLCSNTFNETKLLESPRGKMLIPEMKRMMLNITTLMDCLTCEKCRVWGKLQTRGLAAAFKAVMTDSDEPVKLQRAEMVALINFARQLSFSIHSVKGQCKEDLSFGSSTPSRDSSATDVKEEL